MKISAKEYKEHFINKAPIDFDFRGIFGRVSKGQVIPTHLTDDPNDRTAFTFGPDGLKSMIGKSHYQMLIDIGFSLSYIKEKVERGFIFQLLIIPEDEITCLANWDGVSSIISNVFPEAYPYVNQFIPLYKEKSFDEIHSLSHFHFDEVRSIGQSHQYYMTTKRLLEYDNTIVYSRAWLYHTLGCRELFKGDGYSYSFTGERQNLEYFTSNRRRDEIEGLEIIDLNIEIPDLI